MGRIYFDGGCGFGLLLVTDYADPRLREDRFRRFLELGLKEIAGWGSVNGKSERQGGY